MSRPLRLYVFEDRVGPNKQRWRWDLVAPNGKKLCTSGEPFFSHSNAVRAAERMLDMLGVNCDLLVGEAAKAAKIKAAK